MLICTPIAVLAAVYLAEYAKQGKIVELIRYAADALASVPSIVMGLFGYALFVEAMGLGLSMVSAALALALLMLPIVMRTTEEAIRAVPRYIRWGAYGLGATKWEMIRLAVLPFGKSGIVSASMLALGRALGETMAVLMILSPGLNYSIKLLQASQNQTIAANIAAQYPEANDLGVSTLIGTGLILFLITFVVNFIARKLTEKATA